MRHYFAIALIGILFASCKKTTVSTRESGPTLNNDELLYLMGGEAFEVQVPADIRPDDEAGLAIRYSDGRIERRGASTGWKPNETVKIVCFRVEKNNFRYAILRNAGDGCGNGCGEGRFPDTQDWMPNSTRSGLAAEDWLVRYSADTAVAGGPRAQVDDFDVIFHIQRTSKGEQAAPPKP